MTKRIITDELILRLQQTLDEVNDLVECNCCLPACEGNCTHAEANALSEELDTLPAISEPQEAAPVLAIELGYEPWTNGYAVGYRHGAEYIYLNPSSEDSEGAPNVFVYVGPHGDPGQDAAVTHIPLEAAQEGAPVPQEVAQEAASAPAFDLAPNFKAIFQQFARDAANAGEALSAGLYRAQFAPEYHWDKPETYRRRALVLRAVQEYLAPATIALQCATSMPDIERLREVMAKTLAQVNTWASEFEASAEAGEEN